MVEIERELTFLAKYLPDDLDQHDSVIITDVYIPDTIDHPSLRLRRRDDHYEMTKKIPLEGDDLTRQTEHTIQLDKAEYDALKNCSQRALTKRRYFYDFNGYRAELDVYEGPLEGLVIIDFEFAGDDQMNAFVPPDICLVDASDIAAIAGGKLAGKSYNDIKDIIEATGYQQLK